jgi:hypothetical protein
VTVASVYRRVLGARFDSLDPAVQRLHSLQGQHRLDGRCTIIGAQSRLGRVIARLVGLPHAAEQTAFLFEIDAGSTVETWTRHFPRRSMRSRLHAGDHDDLIERLGIVRLQFSLAVASGALTMRLDTVRIAGIPWPRAWLPTVWAREHGDGDHFHFDVGARLGRLGLLVAYRGHLDLSGAAPLA